MPRKLQRARLAIFVLGLVTVIFTHSMVSFGEDEDQDSLPLMTVSANRFGSAFELITLDVCGENPELVLPFRVAAENPCWSPDSRAIAYRCHKSGEDRLYVYDFDRGEELNFTNTLTRECEPTWSPDGKKMIFTSYRTRNCELFLANADGSNAINLTNNSAFDSDPAWSPDGKKIAFGSNRSRAWRLYVMDSDGSNVRDLLGHDLDGWQGPNWSPDGTQIVYVGPHNGSLQIFVVSAEGKGEQPITDSPGGNAWPAFSPDGRYIAYIHYDGRPEDTDERGTLMVFDVETLKHTPVAPDGMLCVSRVSWQPSPRKEAPPIDPFCSSKGKGD
jgi:tol-pal system beta propeller repeat protein TolB